MPFRRRGKTIQKQNPNGRWVVFRRRQNKTVAEINAEVAALNINISARERRRGRRG